MGEVGSLGRVLNQSLPKENRNSQSLLRFYSRRTETDQVITQILPKENKVITQILPKENRNRVITQILPKGNRNSPDSDSTKGEQKQS